MRVAYAGACPSSGCRMALQARLGMCAGSAGCTCWCKMGTPTAWLFVMQCMPMTLAKVVLLMLTCMHVFGHAGFMDVATWIALARTLPARSCAVFMRNIQA